MKFIKKNIKLITSIFFVVTLFTTMFFVFGYLKSDKYRNYYINKVLKKDSYSYLPVSAQDYIKDAYFKTGEVVLTEKNKRSGKPYLNPEYVDYMELSDLEKNEMSLIPNTYNIESDFKNVEATNLPSSYNISNVNGNSYITGMKDQSTSNICWAFVSSEIAESFLMINKNNPNDNHQFSPKHMDYATSNNGMINYTSEYAFRGINTGGNFFYASNVLANGVSLVSEDSFPFSLSNDQKNFYDIYNYSNSEYELNSTIDIPQFDFDMNDPNNQNLKTNYLSVIKTAIMENGGAYIGTQSPQGTCASIYQNKNFVRVDNNCVQDNAHALQIIGWDDNIEYKYCKSGLNHTNYTTSCSSANTVTSKGAWILRNSWGTKLPIVYLSYDSMDSDISFVSGMSSMNNRKWDNDYHTSLNKSGAIYNINNDFTTYDKLSNYQEKIEKIKFYSSSENGKYTVSVCTNNKDDCNDVSTVVSTYPGYITIDLSDKNIMLNNNKFSVKVKSTNKSFVIMNSVSVFTSNIDKTYLISTNSIESSSNSIYNYALTSITKNIPDGSTITYQLFNSSNKDVSNKMSISNNKVSQGSVSGTISFDSDLPIGVYNLKSSYGGKSYNTQVILSGTSMEGNGTKESPYLIDSIPRLKLISQNKSAYYKLTSDLDLSTYAGSFATISEFSGNFDGNNHVLSNFNVPLFDYVYGNNTNNTAIYNLTLKNFNINNSNVSGILTNNLNDGNYNVSIDNINIIEGSVISTSMSGALIGRLNVNKTNTISINGIYNSATISGTASAGLIGTTVHSGSGNVYINVSNIQNVGLVSSNTNASYIFGTLQNVIPKLSNFVVTGLLTENDSCHGVIGYVNSENIIQNAIITNGYYSNGDIPYPYFDTENSNNVSKEHAWNLKNIPSWTNVSQYWSIPTINGISYMMTLKYAQPYIEHTKIDPINLNVGDNVPFVSFLTPLIDPVYNIALYSNDENILKIEDNGMLNGIEKGSVTLYIASDYDGYYSEMPVTVVGDDAVIVTFHKNDGSNETKTQKVNKDINTSLNNIKFIREGYVLDSWNTLANGNGTSYQLTGQINVSENISLYAIWSLKNYKINYNNNGDNTVQNFTYESNTKLMIPQNEKMGYKFIEWNTREDGTGDSFNPGIDALNLVKNGIDEITLYAIYKPINYTITYSNNSEQFVKSYTYDKNDYFSDITNYSEYAFLGWNTKSDGKGNYYYPGDEFKNLSSVDNDNITLYAIWGNTMVFNPIKYEYNKNELMLNKVVNNTKVNSFITNLNVTEGYSAQVYKGSNVLGSNEFVPTGSKVKILKNGRVVSEFTNVVRGDASGDGLVDSMDYIMIRLHIMGTSRINDKYIAKSIDVNEDGLVDSMDYIMIRIYIMKGGEL